MQYYTDIENETKFYNNIFNAVHDYRVNLTGRCTLGIKDGSKLMEVFNKRFADGLSDDITTTEIDFLIDMGFMDVSEELRSEILSLIEVVKAEPF